MQTMMEAITRRIRKFIVVQFMRAVSENEFGCKDAIIIGLHQVIQSEIQFLNATKKYGSKYPTNMN